MFVSGQVRRELDAAERFIRRRAHWLLRSAVKFGRVVPPDECEQCGTEAHNNQLHGHHDDYNEPLDVRWLCRRCHNDIHRAERSHRAGGFTCEEEDDE